MRLPCNLCIHRLLPDNLFHKSALDLHFHPQEDWLGLRQLRESGRLQFLEAPGRHMQFSLDWFESTILWGHLAGADDDVRGARA